MTITPLYISDKGETITTHSMLKTFNRCPKAAQYKYAERLKRRYITARQKPLKRGTWFHSLLEEYYAGRSWRAKHEELTKEFNKLYDEEKMALGDLPEEMRMLMRSYLWHYGANKDDRFHGWDVKGTEITLECPWPDGEGIYRCRLDLMYEDAWGFWIADHKTNRSLPDTSFRLRDMASALYIWCARENGYPVDGFVWNYIKAKVPSTPQMAYVGKARERLSTAACETDYPTYRLAVADYAEQGLNVSLNDPEVKRRLAHLKSQRWEYGAVQSSPFFRRDTLVKEDDMLAQVLAAAMRTRDRMHTYDWDSRYSIERVPDLSCERMCEYSDLCSTELFGGNSDLIRRKQFRTEDPMAYYGEIKDEQTA